MHAQGEQTNSMPKGTKARIRIQDFLEARQLSFQLFHCAGHTNTLPLNFSLLFFDSAHKTGIYTCKLALLDLIMSEVSSVFYSSFSCSLQNAKKVVKLPWIQETSNNAASTSSLSHQIQTHYYT
ncbi:hypothetical protein XENOCAPTIV_016889 [Xenoophorus captivus]|uniref:Uncharacterized protein n=1 Tax=Xenoophorus captivus TaxID=1517983 RepID=A0ABV0QB84_9TELE